MSLLLILNRFQELFSVFTVDFEQVGAHWLVFSFSFLVLLDLVTCNMVLQFLLNGF